MTATNQNIILFEIDRPRWLLSPLYFNPANQLPLAGILNFEPGIWFYVMTPGAVVVEDDEENEGYYHYQNTAYYNIATVKVNDVAYRKVNGLPSLRTTDSSWYYDQETTKLYLHFNKWEPPLNKEIVFGAMMGYSWKESENCYYDDQYYEPRISKLFPIKKSIDPLFWGLLKFQAAKVELINNDGGLDNWEVMNLFAQTATLLKGNEGDDYEDFEIIYKGFIENNDKNFEKFSVNIQDERKSFTQKISQNVFTVSVFPGLEHDGESSSDIGEPVPIAWGKIYRAKAVCLNPYELYLGSYVFLFADVTLNSIVIHTETYINGKTTPITGSGGGQFWINPTTYPAVVDNLDNLTCDFTATSTENGVTLITELMDDICGVDYTSEFWDTAEVAVAEALALDTSIYVDDADKTVADIIAQICADCDLRFFQHDNGLWTIRVYDEDRVPAKTIYADEWLDEPQLSNNASQFMTSVVVGYKKKQDTGDSEHVTKTDYEADVGYPFESTETYLHDIYKSYKTTTFETNLITKTEAKEKAKAIMRISGNIQNIASCTTIIDHDDLEITDFVIASLATRYGQAEEWGVYEIMEISKDYEKNNIKLNLRYVKAYVE